MEKKILGISLTLLTIILWISPFAAAFAANDWNIRRTIMPAEEEIENIQNKIEEISNPSTEKLVRIKNLNLNPEQKRIKTTISSTAPPETEITIEQISGKFLNRNNTTIAILQKNEEINIPPNQTKETTITAETTEEGQNYITKKLQQGTPTAEILASLRLTDLSIKLKIYGISIKFTQN